MRGVYRSYLKPPELLTRSSKLLFYIYNWKYGWIKWYFPSQLMIMPYNGFQPLRLMSASILMLKKLKISLSVLAKENKTNSKLVWRSAFVFPAVVHYQSKFLHFAKLYFGYVCFPTTSQEGEDSPWVLSKKPVKCEDDWMNGSRDMKIRSRQREGFIASSSDVTTQLSLHLFCMYVKVQQLIQVLEQTMLLLFALDTHKHTQTMKLYP